MECSCLYLFSKSSSFIVEYYLSLHFPNLLHSSLNNICLYVIFENKKCVFFISLGRPYGLLLFIQAISGIFPDLEVISGIVESVLSISASPTECCAFTEHVLLEVVRSKLDELWWTENGADCFHGIHVWRIMSLVYERHGCMQYFSRKFFCCTRQSLWVETVPALKQKRFYGESEGANSACGFLLDVRFAHAACHCHNTGTLLCTLLAVWCCLRFLLHPLVPSANWYSPLSMTDSEVLRNGVYGDHFQRLKDVQPTVEVEQSQNGMLAAVECVPLSDSSSSVSHPLLQLHFASLWSLRFSFSQW